MPTYDVTATCTADTTLATGGTWFGIGTVDGRANFFGATSAYGYVSRYQGTNTAKGLFAFRIPLKPAGAGVIKKMAFVLTNMDGAGGALTARWAIRRLDKIQRDWSEASATWSLRKSVNVDWNVRGGDRETGTALYDSTLDWRVTAGNTRVSSFSWDITPGGYNWGDNDSVTLEQHPLSGTAPANTIATNTASYAKWISLNSATGTTALLPHIVVSYEDESPAAVTNLQVLPDTSLTEASNTFRQYPRLQWTESGANDFTRYRIRSKVRASGTVVGGLSNLTHLTFILTRASAYYLDKTFYNNGSSVYYAVYTEDEKNRTGSTNAFIPAQISFRRPLGPTLTVPVTSASTLDLVTANAIVRSSHVATKFGWGDGSWTLTYGQDTTGSFFQSTHRYTRATTVTIRAWNQDDRGFRSSRASVTRVIAALPPVANITAEPAVQRTASTFSIGNSAAAAAGNIIRESLHIANAPWINGAPADGYGSRIRTKHGSAGSYVVLLLRPEATRWRIVYANEFTTATTGDVTKNIEWRINKGDYVGVTTGSNTAGMGAIQTTNATALGASITWASTAYKTPGGSIGKHRFVETVHDPIVYIKTAYTNPILFSAKDSFSRTANRPISQFRWVTNLYSGTFPATAASYVNTKSSVSYQWYAWTASTFTSMTVRAVDTGGGSSVNVAPVRIWTEATFRFPADIRDAVTNMTEHRERAFKHDPIVGADYGSFDLGFIGPRTIDISGIAVTVSSTTNDLIDISRLNAVFQQRKRCFVVSPASAATALQGYMIDAPYIQQSESPTEKRWKASIRVVKSG